MILIEITFWIALFALLHSYVFYPIIIKFFRKLKVFRPSFRLDDEDLPTTHILIAAYNEEAVIEQKLNSIFAVDFPKNKLKIWIGSDASTDKTDEIIQQFQHKEIELNFTRFAGRSGKPHIINSLAEKVKNHPVFSENDIYIITDANVFFKTDTIYHLVNKFKDENLGLVGACVKNTHKKSNAIGNVESIYIGRENKIKIYESQAMNAVIGVFGGCFAIKSAYFSPTPSGFIADDFFTTMDVIAKGKKVIVAENAIVEEDLPDSMQIEFKRKRRISAGNFQNMKYFWRLWMPPFGLVRFSFFSHKILRWLGPIFLIIIAINGNFLYWIERKNLYFPIFMLSVFCILLLLLKKTLPNFFLFKIKILNAISYFLLMNLALLFGLFDFLKGIKTNTWERTERNLER